uniref:alpha/beta hydrolase family protein n=1 Tax=unclassified Variovorax TaxID=663243 RepID=UPI00104BEED3
MSALALLASCGGGGGSSPATSFALPVAPAPAPAPAPPVAESPPEQPVEQPVEPVARGTVLQGAAGAVVSAAQVDAGTSNAQIQALTGTAACGVAVHHVDYMTRAPGGAQATASTAVMVPTGPAAQCTGSRPVLLYGHGTSLARSFDMAAVSTNAEAAMVMAFYAAQGFIVVAPNYLGYDTSNLGHTTYLNAEASAVDMIDGLRAAKHYLADAGGATQPSSRLFIAGYSQGGHVAMATQRTIERDHAGEFDIVASGPMSGPYSLVNFVDYVFNGSVNVGATLFTPLMLTSYQKAYDNIYASPSEVYQSPYDVGAETLLPSDTPLADLEAAGKRPADGPDYRALFGSGGLLTDAFKAGYTTSNYRGALKANSLIDWTPRHPVALCGGSGDPSVFFINTTDAATAWLGKGASVVSYNLENASSIPVDLRSAVAGGFAQAKATASADAGGGSTGAAAVSLKYHGTLVPPFCNVMVRSFFQQALAGT